LANDANQIGRYEVAAQAAKRAIALGPRQTFPRVNLMTAFAALNRFSEATSAAHDVLARTPENISAHIALYAIARHLGDVATADRELAWAAQRPPSSGMLYVEAEDAGQHGRFEQMTRLFRESARLDRDAGNGEGGGNTLAFSAVLNSLAGRSDAALADAATAATLGHNEIILGSVGVVDARAGRAEAARQSLEALNRTYPLSTYALGMYGPMVRSAQLAQTPAAAAAITAATSAELPYEFGQYGSMIAPYLRGLAYMAAHAPDLAVVEFQKLIDHVGVDPGSPLYAMGYLGVARADAAVGKHEESQKAYKALHELWADAERDTPIVRAALAESVEAHRF
jgi:tetratricopeptide (TPR) repeat protein